MKFTLVKDLKEDTLMRPILNGLLLFMLLYLLSDVLVKHFSFGVFVEHVSLTLFGNEDEFVNPLGTASFLEFWHVEIFFMMMILLTLSAVYIRVAKKSNYKIIFINILMLSAISTVLFLALSFFVSSSFVELYVICFFSWHITAIFLVLYSLKKLNYE